MKKQLTFFAKGVVYLVGVAALAVCFILIPELVREEAVGKETNIYVTIFFLGQVYILAALFFMSLYQAYKLLQYIDANKIFSSQTIKALQKIKVCAVVFSILVVIGVVAGISIAKSVDPAEDVTFMFPLGIIFTLVPSIIAVVVAVLQKLVADAVSLKSENDLIV